MNTALSFAYPPASASILGRRPGRQTSPAVARRASEPRTHSQAEKRLARMLARSRAGYADLAARLAVLEKAAGRICPCSRQLEDLRSDVDDLFCGETRIWAGLDLTREQAGFGQIPDESGTTEPYDAAALLGMKPAAMVARP